MSKQKKIKQTARELVTLDFDVWNNIHYAVVFFPVIVIAVAIVLSKIYL